MTYANKKEQTKSIYILCIYIVYVAFFAFWGFYPMGILWEWYGNPMGWIGN